jgi:hypothetical protein
MSEPKEILLAGWVKYTAAEAIAAETVTIVADLDIDDVAGYDGATEDLGGARTLATLATRQEIPRNVVVTITDADKSITAGNVTVRGLDASGQPVGETFSMTSGAGTTTFTGDYAYSVISSVVAWGFAGVTNADDNLKVGCGTKIGLPMGANCKLENVYFERHNNANVAVNSEGINRTYGTYLSDNLGAGDHDIEFWYTYKVMLNW